MSKQQQKKQIKTAENLARLADYLERTKPKVKMGRYFAEPWLPGFSMDAGGLDPVVHKCGTPSCALGHATSIMKVNASHFVLHKEGHGFSIAKFGLEHFPSLYLFTGEDYYRADSWEYVFDGELSDSLEETVDRLRIMSAWLSTRPKNKDFESFIEPLVSAGFIEDYWRF